MVCKHRGISVFFFLLPTPPRNEYHTQARIMRRNVRWRVTRCPHPHLCESASQLLAGDDGPMGFDYLEFYKRGHREQVAMAFGIDLKSLDEGSPPAQSQAPVSQGAWVLLAVCSADTGCAFHRRCRRKHILCGMVTF